MAVTYPGQMYDYTLDALKGWPRPTALDLHGSIDPATNIGSAGFLPLRAGSCVHISSAVAPTNPGIGGTDGVPNPVFAAGANLGQMAIFLWEGADSYNVSNPGVPTGVPVYGTATNLPGWIPVQPSGIMNGLVAVGAYELETTQFDSAQTYACNDYLRAVTSNTNAAAGQLSNKGNTGGGSPGFTSSSYTLYTDSTVGVVSRGAYVNKHGIKVLSFWPVYLPGTR